MTCVLSYSSTRYTGGRRLPRLWAAADGGGPLLPFFRGDTDPVADKLWASPTLAEEAPVADANDGGSDRPVAESICTLNSPGLTVDVVLLSSPTGRSSPSSLLDGDTGDGSLCSGGDGCGCEGGDNTGAGAPSDVSLCALPVVTEGKFKLLDGLDDDGDDWESSEAAVVVELLLAKGDDKCVSFNSTIKNKTVSTRHSRNQYSKHTSRYLPRGHPLLQGVCCNVWCGSFNQILAVADIPDPKIYAD